MIYEFRCSETLLTRDALFETLLFLYHANDELERSDLFMFAMTICDSWTDVDGSAGLWLWLVDRFKCRPKRKRLTIQDLNVMGDKINAATSSLTPNETSESDLTPLGTISADGDTIRVNSCTPLTLIGDALVTTLSLIFQPHTSLERRQISSFVDALCRVWTTLDDDPEDWQTYSRWLRTQVQLGRRLTCADLGSLAEKMDEHLTAFQFLKGPNPTGTV